MQCINLFRFCLWRSCSKANKPRSTSLGLQSWPNFLVSESCPWQWDVGNTFLCHWQWSFQPLLTLKWALIRYCLQYCTLENILSSTAMVVFDARITVNDAMEPLLTGYFTERFLIISIRKNWMCLSRVFLHSKAENPHLLQKTRKWLVNWHFQSIKTWWCRHESTNVLWRYLDWGSNLLHASFNPFISTMTCHRSQL